MNQFSNLGVNGSRQFCGISAVIFSPLLALSLFSLANSLANSTCVACSMFQIEFALFELN